MPDDIEDILKILHIQKGGVPGISKDAPANDGYYLKCEHMDYDTEVEDLHLTNYDEEVKAFVKAIKDYVEKEIIYVDGKTPYKAKKAGDITAVASAAFGNGIRERQLRRLG